MASLNGSLSFKMPRVARPHHEQGGDHRDDAPARAGRKRARDSRQLDLTGSDRKQRDTSPTRMTRAGSPARCSTGHSWAVSGEPEDVANVALFLACDESSYDHGRPTSSSTGDEGLVTGPRLRGTVRFLGRAFAVPRSSWRSPRCRARSTASTGVRDNLSAFTVTMIYAIFAAGTIATLLSVRFIASSPRTSRHHARRGRDDDRGRG